MANCVFSMAFSADSSVRTVLIKLFWKNYSGKTALIKLFQKSCPIKTVPRKEKGASN
jgi:hypothetical protein